jgi:hypothetical protein
MTVKEIAAAQGVSESTALRRMRPFMAKRYIPRPDGHGRVADYNKSDVKLAFKKSK